MSIQNEYSLLDSGHFRKLESVGPYILIRPAPQAMWSPRLPISEWKKADAEFVRYENGRGEWEFRGRKIPESWSVKINKIPFIIKLTDFGHIGVFPEHLQEFNRIRECLSNSNLKPFKCLNLFAHTGALTLSLAQAGAHLVHLDASKKSVDWARENARIAGLEKEPVRWIVDDVKKFVSKEIRRGAKYDGIILDPPSFGRGSKNEVWKIEEDLLLLLGDLSKLFSEQFSFLFLTCHTPGVTGTVMQNMIQSFVPKSGKFESGELTLKEEKSSRHLPSGFFSLWLHDRG